MKYPFFGLLFLTVIFFGCGDNKPATPPTSSPTPPKTTSETPATPTPESQITENLLAYYQAIESKSNDIDGYFAPVVEKFYSQKNQRNDKVGAIIRNGYGRIKERKITLNENSITITPSGNNFEVSFKGHSSTLAVGETERKEEDFHNLFVFDQNYKILQYGSFKAGQLTPKGNEATAAGAALPEVKDIVFNSLKKSDLNDADACLHPGTGVIYITKSGAFDAIYLCKTLVDIPKFSPWMKETLAEATCGIKLESLPEFDCEDFSKKGCFLAEEKGYNRISNVIKGLQDNELLNLSGAQVVKAKAIEKQVQLQLVLTPQSLALLFGKIDGKWHLLVVDGSVYDCSA